MKLTELIARDEAKLADLLSERAKQTESIGVLRDTLTAKDTADEADERAVTEALEQRAATDKSIDDLTGQIEDRKAEQARDEQVDRLQADVKPVDVRRPAYDRVTRVGSEERTYAPHKDRGFDSKTGEFARSIKPGADFLRDLGGAFFGDFDAREKLSRHMAEERVEHPQWFERAAGTGAFAGLTVPQYLTDLYAPAAAAMRPFADACNPHELPSAGMTVNLSRITTATSAALQASENTGVSETNIDDTLLTINVLTNAGQQTLSRQAIERGTGVEGAMLDDLFRRYATNLDSTLLNQATTGLAAASTLIAYTDGTPTVAELYPLTLQALAAVEAAMLDQASGENIIVMHSRRWYWLQNALSSTWPLMAQPGYGSQMWGANFAKKYGDGARGILPNGTPVIVDNNVTTAGLAQATTGGTQDQIYVTDQRECHLWEDPSAPVFIRAEQPAAASLGVLFVVYGYFAYTFQRYAQSQVIAGTGTIPPTFTGV